MATYAVERPGLTGSVLTDRTTNSGGDSISGVSSGEPLWITFTVGATPSTVTINDPNSQSPLSAKTFDPDVEFTVAANTTRTVKLANPSRFINSTGSLVALAYTSVTGLTFTAAQ